VPSYLIEVYVSRSRARDMGDGGSRVRAAAAQLTREEVAIRYVRTTFLPGDETCFHLVEASSSQVVTELCRRLDLGEVRIVEAVET
jgi:hypothetical protein